MVTEVKRPKLEDWRFDDSTYAVLKQIGYEPTGKEQADIVRGRHRFEAVVGGDQSGKSITAGTKYILNFQDDLVDYPNAGISETLLYWLVAADYERTRAEFNYIVTNLTRMGLPVEASKRLDPGEITVQIKGSKVPLLKVETKSAKDPRTLAMFAPQGIIICEASQVDLDTFQRCLARVGPKRGWMYMSGSYEGSLGWYPGIIKAWSFGSKDYKSYRLPTTTNWHLYPGGENDPELLRQKSNTSDDWYLERIMGIASPPKGMVFSEFRPDIHIQNLEYDPNLPVYIWEDPGYGHAHAIEIAQVHQGGQIHVFDEIYERGIITEDLIFTIMHTRPWWANTNKTLVIDPNYQNQHAGTHSIAEIWRNKTGLIAMGTKVRIAEGTERLKSFLKLDNNGVPRILFDSRCKGVLSEMGALPNPFDGQTRVYSWQTDREGNIVGEEPEDKYNDGCKAVIYGLVERFGLATSNLSNKITIQYPGYTKPQSPFRQRSYVR